ncbi:helix-turn-helix domain-containing protein [Actinoplanes sp. NPDC023714]|uniref:IclR family transcriptional regulator domain-containing protein n=1 Tax=Actinoplanes sp. NPDC023714 TaxID=3154322 RepID=UPI0033CFDE5B
MNDASSRLRGRRPPAGDPVVDRALSLLFTCDAGHPRLTLSELSRRSKIPASSALRLANRLLAWGVLERDDDGRFAVGLRLFEVASLAQRGHGLREVALPYMGDLAEATRQHVLLAVRDGTEAVLVERFSGHDAIPVLYRVGGRLPLHATGVGLILLDLHRPDPGPDLPPVILFVHGGGRQRGSRRMFCPTWRDWRPDPFARLVAEGFAVASADYRLSGEAPSRPRSTTSRRR